MSRDPRGEDRPPDASGTAGAAEAVTSAPYSDWTSLLRARYETGAPEGWRSEIRAEGVLAVPPPSAAHSGAAEETQCALYRVVPAEWGIYQTLSLAFPLERRLFVPDLVVVPRTALPRRDGPESLTPGSAALLVVEITSKADADHDRIVKRRHYARAGIPLYLLIDHWDPRGPGVTLLSRPGGEDYDDSHRVSSGPITIPEPFNVRIDSCRLAGPPA
ncbi:Uma2 family endonuclease [Allonocardiopsis opalescens]|uniref:Uma2 family endonuclease n=1 Tax=Allonocardiopsis opalescens TaxID=1144618 RepID=A0A2T0QDT8_9ACTN|nr:Uma2 family endonuclease [Allonocardiopsis opalescens]PRY02013.1 Uma2 family endonuclease [Allonocardiopsis opalescens]